jgi:hypothetical protein
MSELFQQFSSELESLSSTLRNGKIPENFREEYEALCAKYFCAFHRKTERYHRPVVQKKELEFKESLIASTKLVYLDGLKLLYKKSIFAFTVALEKALSELSGPETSFSRAVADSRQFTMDGFRRMASAMILFGKDAEWDYGALVDELSEAIESIVSAKRDECLEKSKQRIREDFLAALSEAIGPKLENTDMGSFWEEIQATYESVAEDGLARLLIDIEGNWCWTFFGSMTFLGCRASVGRRGARQGQGSHVGCVLVGYIPEEDEGRAKRSFDRGSC